MKLECSCNKYYRRSASDGKHGGERLGGEGERKDRETVTEKER